MPKEPTFAEQYPELDEIADKMADEICEKIDALKVKTKCPYPHQGILEQVIYHLQKSV